MSKEFVIRHSSFVILIMSGVEIHPTAIVDPKAELGAETIVGPYCIVGSEVVLGEGCWLQHHVTLCGPMRAGAKNKFYAYCSIGQQTQDLKYAGEPTYLQIGHDCTVGNSVVFSNNGTLAGHVEIGDHAVMGGLTAVHQFCRIGRFAITGGCSKIVQDVPPFLIADGNPAEIRGVNLIGLERAGFTPESIKAIKEAFRLIYRSKLNTRQAIEAVRKQIEPREEITQLIEFIEKSARGIVR